MKLCYQPKGAGGWEDSHTKDQIGINQVIWVQPITANVDCGICSDLHNNNLSKMNGCKSRKSTIDM